MSDAVLVLNAGSSSLKFTLFEVAGEDGLALDCHGSVDELHGEAVLRVRDATDAVLAEHSWHTAPGHRGALEVLLPLLQNRLGSRRLLAVGHRVVHGGLKYSAPLRLTAQVLEELGALVPLAPLHQPHNLLAIELLQQALGAAVPQVACFDTAFHRTVPEVAQAFALPASITSRGVRRYGFHGLSYESIAGALPAVDARAASGKTVVLHLGNGASLCAMRGGQSVATTMGFTALDGLMMGTRTGTIDPGVILYALTELKLSVKEVETLLYTQSGLLGVSGLSSDMRTLQASDAPAAKAAIEQFIYRASRELGSMAAALGGLDALVFTAGIGEHSALIREGICRGAQWLGVELDAEANGRHGPRISTPSSRTAAFVVPTDEELVIARHAVRLVNSGL